MESRYYCHIDIELLKFAGEHAEEITPDGIISAYRKYHDALNTPYLERESAEETAK